MQKPINSLFLLGPVFILVFPFWILYGQIVENPVEAGDLSNTDAGIVASVGGIQISSTEFLANYQFGPAFFKRQNNARNRYLNTMIHEKLLALDGYGKNLHQQVSVKRALKAYRDDIITEELYKELIMNRISVSEEEIEASLPEARKQIDLAWIFSSDAKDSYMMWQQLESGISFDSLYRIQITDSVRENDRTLSMTIYELRNDQPEVFHAINNLIKGEQTKPIQGPDGWYIFKIRNIWTPMILTQSEAYKLKHELERSLFKNKLDVESDIFVNRLMDSENPVIDKTGFSSIVYFVNTRAATHVPYDWEVLKTKLKIDQKENESKSVYDNIEYQILVTGKSIDINNNEFKEWYIPRAAYLKMPGDSPESFILAVQRVVWRMVRDHLLVREAEKRGYDNHPGVIAQTAWWQDKIVYQSMKAEIARTIHYTEEDLRNFYNENLMDFRYASGGDIIPFEKARQNVESALRKQIYMDTLMRHVLNLKKEYTIEINDSLLQCLQLSDESDPHSIDLYAVKRGGLLPRQPYPTIDWEWQLWY